MNTCPNLDASLSKLNMEDFVKSHYTHFALQHGKHSYQWWPQFVEYLQGIAQMYQRNFDDLLSYTKNLEFIHFRQTLEN